MKSRMLVYASKETASNTQGPLSFLQNLILFKVFVSLQNLFWESDAAGFAVWRLSHTLICSFSLWAEGEDGQHIRGARNWSHLWGESLSLSLSVHQSGDVSLMLIMLWSPCWKKTHSCVFLYEQTWGVGRECTSELCNHNCVLLCWYFALGFVSTHES